MSKRKHKHKKKHDGRGPTKPPVMAHHWGRCYEKHSALALGNGTLLGASCLQPRDGFDVYVGLDEGMERRHLAFPWQPASKVVEVKFPIRDGGVPTDVAQFERMVRWLVERLGDGQRVHIGCIGGHGRTGMLMAAIVRVLHGDLDAGRWVRENYCKEAIETSAQVEFLRREYGITPVELRSRWASPHSMLGKRYEPLDWFEPAYDDGLAGMEAREQVYCAGHRGLVWHSAVRVEAS